MQKIMWYDSISKTMTSVFHIDSVCGELLDTCKAQDVDLKNVKSF